MCSLLHFLSFLAILFARRHVFFHQRKWTHWNRWEQSEFTNNRCNCQSPPADAKLLCSSHIPTLLFALNFLQHCDFFHKILQLQSFMWLRGDFCCITARQNPLLSILAKRCCAQQTAPLCGTLQDRIGKVSTHAFLISNNGLFWWMCNSSRNAQWVIIIGFLPRTSPRAVAPVLNHNDRKCTGSLNG